MELLYFYGKKYDSLMKQHLKHLHPGWFITFEGPEGAGKSTQIQLLCEYLEQRGFRCVVTREPGGTPLAEKLRTIVKNHAGPEKLHGATELLLIEAARSQHVREVIRPHLAEGEIVLCDRFFDSTTAYQGGARGMESQLVELLNHFAAAECRPDLTILLDLTPEAGFARTRKRTETIGEHDRFEEEQLDFHRRVRETFLAIAGREPDRFRVIDADRDADAVFQSVREAVDELI